jgi:hypothetical protein
MAKSVKTLTGTELNTNSDSVATSIGKSVDQLNEALLELGRYPDASVATAGQLEATLRSTLLSLNAMGVTGLNLSSTKDGLHITADQDSLSASLHDNAVSIVGDLEQNGELGAMFGNLLDKVQAASDAKRPLVHSPLLSLDGDDLRNKLNGEFPDQHAESVLLLYRAATAAGKPTAAQFAQGVQAYLASNG